MVAELPVDSGTLMAAMMLQVVVAGSLLVAMGTCIVYGFFEMRRREQEYEFTMGINDLPTVTIATKTGTKYHRKNCQHLLTHVCGRKPQELRAVPGLLPGAVHVPGKRESGIVGAMKLQQDSSC